MDFPARFPGISFSLRILQSASHSTDALSTPMQQLRTTLLLLALAAAGLSGGLSSSCGPSSPDDCAVDATMATMVSAHRLSIWPPSHLALTLTLAL